MAEAQSDQTLILDSNPSEAALNGQRENEGKMLSQIGSDDFVIATNILDGKTQITYRGEKVTLPRAELILRWGNVPHRWKPGQTVNLPGYKGRHFLLHLVKTCYVRILDDADRNDRRDYPLSDPFVKLALVQLQEMMASDVDNPDSETVQEMPDYVAGDDNLQSAMGGQGEQVLETVKDDQPDATIESEARFDGADSNITPSTIDAEKQAAKDAAKNKGTASKTKETPLP